MPASTPIAHSKTAALSRVLDAVPRGYTHYTSGVIKPEKAIALANKFHGLYGIGCTPGQRIARKKRGEANAMLVMFWLENCGVVEWLMLVTPGSGPVHECEKLQDVTGKPRLTWLGYELARYGARGVTRWTWRRPKEEMENWYAVLTEQVHRRQSAGVTDVLAAIARQPGFHGVREQSWALCQYALRHGFQGELPFLFYVHKVSHGERLLLAPVAAPGAARCPGWAAGVRQSSAWPRAGWAGSALSHPGDPPASKKISRGSADVEQVATQRTYP